MNKLLKFKSWLDLNDAAKRLSIVAGEDVSTSDILQLALENHLTLSAYFPSEVYTRPARLIPLDAAQIIEGPNPFDPSQTLRIVDGLRVNETHVLETLETNKAYSVSGIFDLPLLWGSRTYIENLLYFQKSGKEPDSFNILGTFVHAEDDLYHQLLNIFPKPKERGFYSIDNFYPAIGLPDDSILVIRTSELSRFENEISESQKNENHQPMEEKYTSRLLTIQAQAIQKFWANYDPSQPDTAEDNSTIITWLKEQGCSKREAEAIDLLIRHDTRKRGGAKPRI